MGIVVDPDFYDESKFVYPPGTAARAAVNRNERSEEIQKINERLVTLTDYIAYMKDEDQLLKARVSHLESIVIEGAKVTPPPNPEESAVFEWCEVELEPSEEPEFTPEQLQENLRISILNRVLNPQSSLTSIEKNAWKNFEGKEGEVQYINASGEKKWGKPFSAMEDKLA